MTSFIFQGGREELHRLVQMHGHCLVNVWDTDIQVTYDKPIPKYVVDAWGGHVTTRPIISCHSKAILKYTYLPQREPQRFISENKPLLWRCSGTRSRKFTTKTALSNQVLGRVFTYLCSLKLKGGEWTFTHGKQKIDTLNHTGVWRLRPAGNDVLTIMWRP